MALKKKRLSGTRYWGQPFTKKERKEILLIIQQTISLAKMLSNFAG